MSTIRDQIIQAVITALETDAPEGIPAPVRTPLDSPSAAQLPALTVYQLREIVAPMRDKTTGAAMRGPVVRRVLDLNIEVIGAWPGAGADAELDPILAWITSSVVGAGTFDGLADNPADEAGTAFQYEQGQLSLVRAIVGFRFEYQTARDNAESHT